MDIKEDIKESIKRRLSVDYVSKNKELEVVGSAEPERYPATLQQLQYYYYQLLNEEDTSYNLLNVLKISGEINQEIFRAAMQSLLIRYPVLRTVFVEEGNEIIQEIMPLLEVNVAINSISSDQFEQELSNAIKPFKLNQFPLFRVELYIVDKVNYLFFDIHHIIADEISSQILLKELFSIYCGNSISNNSKPFKYYTLENYQKYQEGTRVKSAEFWSKMLKDINSQLNLPRDILCVETQEKLAKIYSFEIPEAISTKIRHYAAKHTCTPYILLLTIYSVTLRIFTDQQSISIGSSFANRNNREYQDTVGLFVNTVPFILNINDNDTFLSLLDKVKSLYKDILRHIDYPIYALKYHDKQFLRTNFFETIFEYHLQRNDSFKLAGLDISIHHLPAKNAKFDLSLEVIACQNKFNCFIEFDKNKFFESTINSIADVFLGIINTVLVDGNLAISALPIKTEQYLQHLSKSKNFSDNFPCNEISSFISKLSKATGESLYKIACVYNYQHLSYQALDRITNKISRFLLSLNDKLEEPIVVCMPRSANLLLALVSILKAGKVYIPISELDFASSRLQSILDETGCKTVLADDLSIRQICVDDESVAFYSVNDVLRGNYRTDPVNVNIHPLNIAYIMYTSGSTGKPKGVLVNHQGMNNHLEAKVSCLRLGKNDVVAQTSASTFDVSIWQMLTGLCIGATVVILDEDDAWQPARLFNALNKHKVTVYETVPSHMHILLEYANKFGKPLELSLKYFISNGEELRRDLAEEFKCMFPHAILANAYGPTECSDDTHHFFLKGQGACYGQAIPIGYAIRNVYAVILDKYFRPVPLGKVGDLYVAGKVLARGYLNNPRETASKFIPISQVLSNFDCGSLMYTTGDKAKYLTDGSILYLGRLDDQIKIRGMRIELTELNKLLCSVAEVRQGAVLPIKQNSIDYLVAFVKLYRNCEGSEEKELISRIKSHIKSNSLKHVVLDDIVFIEEIPVTSNGKLDKTKLKQKYNARIPALDQQLVFTNKTQRILIEIISDVLNKPIVSLDDDLFELGLHSLLALQFISKVAIHLHTDLSLKKLYAHSTIRQLAEHVNSLSINDKIDINVATIIEDKLNRFEPFPVTDVQQSYLLGRGGLYNLGGVSVHVYQEYECQTIDVGRLEQAWNILIKRHEGLRIVFPNLKQQQILQEVPYYKIKQYNFSQSDSDLAQLDALRLEMSHYVFPVDTWPLFDIRVVYLRNGCRLFLSFDVLIIDGWSTEILLNEFYQLYKNIDVKLPVINLSFRDYVCSLQSFKQTKKYEEDKKYWLDKIDIFPPAPSFQLKTNAKLSAQTFSRISKRISSTTWLKLKKQIKQYKMSLTAFIAFVFSEVIAAYSGSNEFVLNLTMFNRFPVHRDINNVVGDFTSLLLLACDLSDSAGKSFYDRLLSFQNDFWQDFSHITFSGVEFVRELTKNQAQSQDDKIIAPVVLTSILGLDDNLNDNVDDFFGKEIFAISQTPQVWLDFKVYEIRGELIIEWDYVEQLFESKLIAQMHDLFINYMHRVSDNCNNWSNYFETPFALVHEKIKSQLTYTSKSFDSSNFYCHLLNSFIKNQEKLAIVTLGTQLTYKEFMLEVCGLAQCLLLANNSSNVVAVYTNKSLFQIVAVVSAILSGRTYLPIDPELPKKRVNMLLEKCNVSLIIVDNANAQELDSLDYIKATENLTLISEKSYAMPQNGPNLNLFKRSYQASHLAYIMFTSGSTGQPKGVSMSLSAFLNTVYDINDKYRLSSADCIFAISNFNFDLSVYDIFAALLSGATIVLPDEKGKKNPEHWLNLFKQYKVTIWNSVPMLMQMLIKYLELDYAQSDSFSSLRLVLLSGDWVPTDLPEKIYKLTSSNDLKVISLGGATEAGIWSNYYEIKRNEQYKLSIPYGYSLTNQKMFILNREGYLVPPYVVGEIYIAGASLAEGYWQEPELTQEAFKLLPSFGRAYKTGDLGMYDNDFCITFLGREDSQVKLDGYRVELVEIEKTAKKFNKHIETVVVTIAGDKNNKQLLLYYKLLALNREMLIEEHENQSSELNNIMIDCDEKLTIALDSNVDITGHIFQRKSYRSFLGVAVKVDIISNLLNSVSAKIEADAINANERTISADILFSCLSKLKAIEGGRGYQYKYIYPSASELYAVKIGIYIGEKINKIGKGFFVFDPIANTLEKVSDYIDIFAESESAVQFLYFADYANYTEKYGPEGKYLAILEAGYMSSVLTNSVKELNIPCSPHVYQDSITLSIKGKQYQLIAAAELRDNKVVQNNFDCLLGVTGESDHYKWLRYDADLKALGTIDCEVGLPISPAIQDTYTIYNQSSFSLFFTLQKDNTNNINAALFNIGAFSQSLMQEGVKQGIGFCPIGDLCEHSRSLLSAIAGNGIVLHSLFAGHISAKQINSQIASQVEKNYFQLQLQRYLAKNLPSYMVPKNIIILREIPLTKNGKVDMKALPKPSFNKIIVKPSKDEEIAVAKIWAELLDRDTSNISLTDNFFEIGGNSLLLISLHEALERKFEITLPITILFENLQLKSLVKEVLNLRLKSKVDDDFQLGEFLQRRYEKAELTENK